MRRSGEPRPTAAIHVANPYCSYKLTRVRSRRSKKLSAEGAPKAALRADVPPKRCCCNSMWRIIAMLGPQALQQKDYRWVIPCVILFSALYGCLIPGLLIVNSEAFVNFGSCLPQLDPINQTFVVLPEPELAACHDEMIEESNLFAGFYFGVSIVAGVLSYMKNVSLQLSIASVTRALRNAIFVNVVRQDIAYFDDSANSPFAISSRLADDADLVAKAYGQPLSSIADVACALTIAYAVALAASWRLVLATVAILPLMAWASRKQNGMRESSQRRAQKLIADASTIAGDAGQDIGTVAAFNMQGTVQSMYEGLVLERQGEGIKVSKALPFLCVFAAALRLSTMPFVAICPSSCLSRRLLLRPVCSSVRAGRSHHVHVQRDRPLHQPVHRVLLRLPPGRHGQHDWRRHHPRRPEHHVRHLQYDGRSRPAARHCEGVLRAR